MNKILIDEATVRLVLKALENSVDLVSQEARNAEELYGKYPSRLARIQGLVAFEVAHEKAITALREALVEQPAQQEPVGAIILGGVIDTNDGPEYEEWEVEWNHKAIDTLQYRLVTGDPVTLNIYTTPQPAQRTWVGLTQEEFRDFASTFEYGTGGLIRAIEAKLKEKNT